MKYGLLVNEGNTNLGDDIQSYAESQFLPSVDVIVDRENLDVFKYGDGSEPVALIMGAWFMWHKYNWPPVNQIVPLNVGYHHYNRSQNVVESTGYSLPIYEEHYSGVGGQWFKDHGKVGARDMYTCEVLDRNGIPNYFSGCVTLTLPKQKETEDKGSYVVLVDLNPKVEKKVRSLLDKNVRIERVSHKTKNIKGASWEERKQRTIEYLTLYQNARFVVTRRLHVALPCLAMGVPVMVIVPEKMNDPNRFEPYRKWLHYCTNAEFLNNGYSGFDFINGTANKEDYLETRNTLTNTIKDFISNCEKNKKKSLDFFNHPSYDELEMLRWKTSMMRGILKKSFTESKSLWNLVRMYREESVLKRLCRNFYKKHILNSRLANSNFIKNLRLKVKRMK